MATNLAALGYFLSHGYILPLLAAAMAVANVSGSMLGTRLALKYDIGFICQLFFIMKFSWDTFSPL